MRIIINIDEGKDERGKKTIRLRSNYYFNGKDGQRVRNCGVEIYKCLKEGIGGGFEGGVIIHEGEKK